MMMHSSLSDERLEGYLRVAGKEWLLYPRGTLSASTNAALYGVAYDSSRSAFSFS